MYTHVVGLGLGLIWARMRMGEVGRAVAVESSVSMTSRKIGAAECFECVVVISGWRLVTAVDYLAILKPE